MNLTPSDIAAEIRRRQRFTVTSHARPDGDAIGSALAMAYALRHLGKTARVVFKDPAPPPMQAFPGVDQIDVVDHVDDPGDAVIVMECGDLGRPGISGLDRTFVINIDHHPGNTMYGQANWFDVSAAACSEMVFDLVQELGVPLTREIATHVYVAILTDTGSFHYSVTPRTFEISRLCAEAGVDAPAVARAVYDNNTLGRLKVFGAVLDQMAIDGSGRIATLWITQALAAQVGATYDDIDGLINQPLTVKDILASVFFKEHAPGEWRVSLRSKGAIDVNAIAREFGGGGHKNASGCSAQGALDQLRVLFEQKLTAAISASHPPTTGR